MSTLIKCKDYISCVLFHGFFLRVQTDQRNKQLYFCLDMVIGGFEILLLFAGLKLLQMGVKKSEDGFNG